VEQCSTTHSLVDKLKWFYKNARCYNKIYGCLYFTLSLKSQNNSFCIKSKLPIQLLYMWWIPSSGWRTIWLGIKTNSIWPYWKSGRITEIYPNNRKSQSRNQNGINKHWINYTGSKTYLNKTKETNYPTFSKNLPTPVSYAEKRAVEHGEIKGSENPRLEEIWLAAAGERLETSSLPVFYLWFSRCQEKWDGTWH